MTRLKDTGTTEGRAQAEHDAPWAPVMNGDWSVEPGEDEDTGACAWQQIADANGKTIAIAVDGHPGWGSETPRLDARVRLISAAPDLLEALKELLGDWGDDDTMDHMPGVKRARAAIAKAAGSK